MAHLFSEKRVYLPCSRKGQVASVAGREPSEVHDGKKADTHRSVWRSLASSALVGWGGLGQMARNTDTV